jgi:hypothetical protein
MQINWEQDGRPIEPGHYDFADGLIYITRREIAIWQQHPDAVFTVISEGELVDRPGLVNYSLGTYSLPGYE